MMIENFGFILAASIMLTAIYTDLTVMKIPNPLVIILITAYPVFHFAIGRDLPSFGNHVIALVAVFLLMMIPFMINQMAGGDVKLAAATAFWIGFNPELLNYILTTGLIGGAFTLLVIIVRRFPPIPSFIGYKLYDTITDTNKRITYGVPMAIAGIYALFPG